MDNENEFLTYGVLKNKKEVKAIQQSDLPSDLIDRLAKTWAITGENYMTSLLVNFIGEALDNVDRAEGRDTAVRNAIQSAYYFLHDCDASYDELAKKYEN